MSGTKLSRGMIFEICVVLGLLFLSFLIILAFICLSFYPKAPSTPKNELLIETEAPKAQVASGLADVYLMPFYGFDESLAWKFANKLSDELGLRVRATTSLPFPKDALDASRKQFIAEKFYEPMARANLRIYDVKPSCVYIGLVRGSIFSHNAGYRFVFALYSQNMAIVGDAEIGALGTAPDFVYNERMLKILKRAIGKLYYNYRPSSDINSLMYSPLMSVKDLDAIGSNYATAVCED